MTTVTFTCPRPLTSAAGRAIEAVDVMDGTEQIGTVVKDLATGGYIHDVATPDAWSPIFMSRAQLIADIDFRFTMVDEADAGPEEGADDYPGA